jgi:DNA-binding CsgD family transcriptional regulator/PAS domain-containing protein
VPAVNRVRNSAKVSPRKGQDALWEPSGDLLEELTASLENSTVGVAFYDQRLRCLTLNHAFAEICSRSIEDFRGKRLSRSFGRDAKTLQPAFERAFSTRTIVSNVELASVSAAQKELRRLFNLYPVADRSARIRMLAVTLCESSGGGSLEFHLAHLVAKLQEELPAATCLLGADFFEILAGSLQSSGRSLRKMRNSLGPRSLLSGVQMEMDLMPLALFLGLTGSRSAAPAAYEPPSVLSETSSRDAGAPEGAPEYLPATERPGTLFEVPSPRELQVLRLLAIGQSNKEIGLALGISTRTVETYRARIIRKLCLHSTAELVRYAIRNKIVEP